MIASAVIIDEMYDFNVESACRFRITLQNVLIVQKETVGAKIRGFKLSNTVTI